MSMTTKSSWYEYDRYIKGLLATSANKVDIGYIRNKRPAIYSKPLTDKVFVFDLDLTAICTQDSIDSLHSLGIYSDPKLMELRRRVYYFHIDDLEKKGIGSRYNFWGVTRPHLHELLHFCTNYGRIVIWSAGKRPYVEAIVSHIFKNLPYPELVLSYDDISFDKQGNVIKPLTKVSQRLGVPLSKILAIDDNELTFQHNVHNGIHIPAYEPKPDVIELAQDEQILIKLKDWLCTPEVMAASDVTTLNKSAIFV